MIVRLSSENKNSVRVFSKEDGMHIEVQGHLVFTEKFWFPAL